MKKLVLSFLLIASIAGVALSQQLPQFSHYSFNGMYLSPGYAGITGHTDLTLIGRYQWAGYNASFDDGGAPRTGLFTASVPVKALHGGLGLQVVQDQLGPDKNLTAQLAYAYHIQIGAGKLGIGVQGGLVRLTKDGTKYRPGMGGDPSIFNGVASDSKFDGGAGLWYQHKSLYAGFGVANLLQSQFKFTSRDQGTVQTSTALMSRHYYLTAGYNLPVSETVTLTPTGILKYDSNKMHYELGGRATFNEKFWVGAGYRGEEAITALAGISFLKENAMRLGYAFDLTTVGKAGKAATSHEILISYRLPQVMATPKPPIKTPRYSF